MPVEFKFRLGPKRPKGSPKLPPKPQGGVGTELLAMLGWLTFLKTPGKTCGCARRAAEMDRNGTAWAEANEPAMIGMLREGAKELCVPFHELPTRYAIRIAITRAKAKGFA